MLLFCAWHAGGLARTGKRHERERCTMRTSGMSAEGSAEATSKIVAEHTPSR